MGLFRMAATIALGTMLVMVCAGIALGAAGNQRVLSQAPASMNSETSPIVTLHVVEVYTYSMSPYGSDSQTTADFDRDGRSYIVIAEVLQPTLTGRLVLFHNLDHWQFAPTILITTPIAGSTLYRAKAADFNQDH